MPPDPQDLTPKPARDVTVLLVDDHEMVRVGLRTLLGQSPGIRVVGEAATVRAGIDAAINLRPTVALVDLRLPDGNGAEVTREIKRLLPDTKVVVLTSFADEALILEVVAAGADGYLLKEITWEKLAEAVHRVAQGGLVLEPTVARRLMNRAAGSPTAGRSDWDRLPTQDQEIVRRVARGMSNKEIAVELGLAETTVRNYLSRIFQRLNLNNRAETAAWYARVGEQPPRG